MMLRDALDLAVKLLLATGIVAAALLIYGSFEAEEAPPAPGEAGPRPGEAPEEPPVRSQRRLENDFSYRVPRGYEVRRSEGVVALTGGDGDTLISIAETSIRRLPSATKNLIDLIERRYDDVKIAALEAGTVNDMPARWLRGHATNESGVRVFFIALTVKGKDGALAVLGFSLRELRTQLERDITEISRSLSPAPQRI